MTNVMSGGILITDSLSRARMATWAGLASTDTKRCSLSRDELRSSEIDARSLFHDLGDFLLFREGCDFSVGLGGLRATHRAMPFENDAFLDDQARRRDVPEQFSRCTNFDALTRSDVTSDAPHDDDAAAGDLRVDDRGFADDQRVLRCDLAFDLA